MVASSYTKTKINTAQIKYLYAHLNNRKSRTDTTAAVISTKKKMTALKDMVMALGYEQLQLSESDTPVMLKKNTSYNSIHLE